MSLVVYMFLGDLRSTLIPTLAVPVSLVGTFFFLQLLGLSINLITLFAMVLAIGVVVDDAIVVVEAVHAKMAEKHLSPYRATMEVLHEISGAIIAITLVMTAVFVPVTFIPGPVGTFYRQFGITMATSIILSGLVALTLTPVLCAMILKPHDPAMRTARACRRTRSRPTDRQGANGADGWSRSYRCWLEWQFSRDSLTWRMSCGGRSASCSFFCRFVRKPFDRAVEKVTGGVRRRSCGGSSHAAMLTIGRRRGLRRRDRTSSTCSSRPASSRARTRASSTRSSRRLPAPRSSTPTPSPTSWRRSPRKLEEVTSVTSLAGYEVLTEGRGSNAGTCIINLRTGPSASGPRARSSRSSRKKCREMTQRQARVLRTARGSRLRRRRRVLLAAPRQDEHVRLQAARRSDRQVHGRPGQAQGAEQPVHLLHRRLPAVRADHRQRRGHAEGRVDREGAGQPQHPHRQHLRARLHPLQPVLQGLRPGVAGVPAVPGGPGEHVRQERERRNGPLLRRS